MVQILIIKKANMGDYNWEAKMAKDLTTSRLDRQNILNNEIAVEEIQEKSGMEGIFWEGKMFVTREMTATFF